MAQLRVFEVFFDKSCPMCAREIKWIQKHNVQGCLKFTDISSREFRLNNSTSKTIDQLMQEIHGRFLPLSESDSDTESNWKVGVEVFREMYGRIGYTKPVAWSRIPIFSKLLEFGYYIFAKIRYKMAVQRMKEWNRCTELCKPERHATGDLSESNPA